MSLQANLSRQLSLDEGRRRQVYKDSLGYDTIGIGRLCDARKPSSGLSDGEIDYLFTNDLNRVLADVLKWMPWVNDLDEARRGAVMNMVFQMGVNGVLAFVNSIAAIRAHRWSDAAANLKQSAWYRQTPERAGRVIEQIRSGVWQFAK